MGKVATSIFFGMSGGIVRAEGAKLACRSPPDEFLIVECFYSSSFLFPSSPPPILRYQPNPITVFLSVFMLGRRFASPSPTSLPPRSQSLAMKKKANDRTRTTTDIIRTTTGITRTTTDRTRTTTDRARTNTYHTHTSAMPKK